MQNHWGSFRPAGVHQITQFGMRPRTGRDRPAKDETGHTVIIDPDSSQMWLTWSVTLLKPLTSTVPSPSGKHMGCSSPLRKKTPGSLVRNKKYERGRRSGGRWHIALEHMHSATQTECGYLFYEKTVDGNTGLKTVPRQFKSKES